MRSKGTALSLLAGIALVSTAAVAAELPTMRSEPAKRARSCRVGGMEGYYVAGSSVCVKVSGYVSAGVEAGKGSSSK
jgi:uncharacterized membrane protein (UPF0136 family)